MSVEDEIKAIEDSVKPMLCNGDDRHPDYAALAKGEMESGYDAPKRSADCACDNCFYGRDRAATQSIRLVAALRLAISQRDTWANCSLSNDEQIRALLGAESSAIISILRGEQ